MINVPSDAKKEAIWCCAFRAMALTFIVGSLIGSMKLASANAWGSGLWGKMRLVRTNVAPSARSPARRIAVVDGLGTVRSPLANWMITNFGYIPFSGWPRRYGAYATESPA